MALSAQQIPRWLNSIKLRSFINATQLTEHFPRPGRALFHGFSARAQISSDNCFLQWGFQTYRTSSTRNSSQSADLSRQESSSSQSTLLSSESEQSEKMPSSDAKLPLQGNSQLSGKSPSPISPHWCLNKLPVYILLTHFALYFLSGKVRNHARSIHLLLLYLSFTSSLLV